MKPIIKKTNNALGAAKRIVKAAVKGESILVSDSVKQQRLKLCDGCPHFQPNTQDRDFDHCGLCGCFTKIKSALATETCPANKWPVTLKGSLLT